MAFYSPDFFLEHFVPKPCLKFPLTCGSCCYAHGLLPATQKDLCRSQCDHREGARGYAQTAVLAQ